MVYIIKILFIHYTKTQSEFVPSSIYISTPDRCSFGFKLSNYFENYQSYRNQNQTKQNIEIQPQFQFIKFIDENKSYRFEFSEHIFTVGLDSLASYIIFNILLCIYNMYIVQYSLLSYPLTTHFFCLFIYK